jgi:hypothetical protein
MILRCLLEGREWSLVPVGPGSARSLQEELVVLVVDGERLDAGADIIVSDEACWSLALRGEAVEWE